MTTTPTVTTAKLKVRLYEDSDFLELTRWAAAREVMIFKELLPKIGGVIFDDETGMNLACGWLYMDNSVGVAFPHWLLANPQNDMATSRESIKLLGEWMEYTAEDLDYGAFVTFFEDGAMTREAEKNGYSIIGQRQNVMFKLLRQ